MTDIFLSFVIEDWQTAKKLTDVFRGQRWTVWWDTHATTPDAEYVKLFRKELNDTKVIVVIWSHSTTLKSFPISEAFIHEGQLPIVPVLYEKGALLPLRFLALQAFDLSDWDGSDSHAALMSLVRHISTLVAGSSAQAKPPASFEELSMPEIQENAKLGIKESAEARPEDGARFEGIFISYRRSEAAAYAGRLYDRLTARFGKEKVFIDTQNVAWGEDFVESITSAAESCAVMVALVSPRWSRGAGGQSDLDDYVRLEVATALGRKIRVIPILIQGASMPAPKDLPEDLSPLARRNALVLSDDARWERDVEDLMKTLDGLLNN